MARYIKKPVEVEAFEWRPGMDRSDWPNWADRAAATGELEEAEGELLIRTLEDGKAGRHTASPGDYVIRGIHGELYACKPDIFAETYEKAD